jgi:hypothetical protein
MLAQGVPIVTGQNISIGQLPSFADKLYADSGSFLRDHGVHVPNSVTTTRLSKQNADWYADFLCYQNMHAELVEELELTRWLAASTRGSHAGTFFAIYGFKMKTDTGAIKRDKQRHQLLAQMYADEFADQEPKISFQDCMTQTGKYGTLIAPDKYEVDQRFDKLVLATCERHFCKAIQNYIDNIIRLLPSEHRNTPIKVRALRKELLESKAIGLDIFILLAGEDWPNSPLQKASIKKYQPQKEPVIVLSTTAPDDTSSGQRLCDAVKLFSSGKASSAADDDRSKVQNNSGKIKNQWWSTKKNCQEIIYTPKKSALIEITPIKKMSKVQLVELLRLIELIKALIDSGKKDWKNYPVGSFYLRVPPGGSVEGDRKRINSLVMMQAIFEALKEKDSNRLKKLTYNPDQAVISLLAAESAAISKFRDELCGLDNNLLGLGERCKNEKEIEDIAVLIAAQASAKTAPASGRLLDTATLLKKQPNFVSRVKKSSKKYGKQIKFILKPIGYLIALPFVIVVSLAVTVFLVAQYIANRTLSFFKGSVPDKPGNLPQEELAPPVDTLAEAADSDRSITGDALFFSPQPKEQDSKCLPPKRRASLPIQRFFSDEKTRREDALAFDHANANVLNESDRLLKELGAAMLSSSSAHPPERLAEAMSRS